MSIMITIKTSKKIKKNKTVTASVNCQKRQAKKEALLSRRESTQKMANLGMNE